MLKGIDISEWQDLKDYNALKRDFDFVIARSSFGTVRADNKFTVNRNGLRSTGQLRGFYHYAYPINNSPEQEAAFCATVIGQLQAGELFALDFEEAYNGDPVQWCLKFLQKFERLTGYKPLIYLNLATIQAYDWTPIVKNDNGLWLAKWDFNPDGNVPPVPWSVVAMRQYSNNLLYNGQRIDGNVFYGDANVFKAYGYKTSNAPTTGGADMYGGLDLNNKDSMKVSVDIFNKVLRGEYVDKAKYDADLKAKDDTITRLNTNIETASQTIKTQQATIAGLQARINLLQPQADKYIETQKLFDQSEEDRKNLINENKSLAASNDLIRKTSYTTVPIKMLIAEILRRITNKPLPQ